MHGLLDFHTSLVSSQNGSQSDIRLAEPIDLAIAFPERLTCTLLANSLRTIPDINFIGYATTPSELESKLEAANFLLVSHTFTARCAHPALELVDLFDHPIKTLIVGVAQEPETIVSYLERGASGYIDDHLEVGDFVEVINRTLQDELITTPEITAHMARRLSDLSTLCGDLESLSGQVNALTRREREVLALIAEGAGNFTIARDLGIEVGTVKNHVHNLLDKLQLKSRHEAALIYRRFLDSNSE